MQLEDCFEFEKFDTEFGEVERIRIKGHRISIEHVLQYFQQGMSPEQIQQEIYPTLTLAEVYTTITYYLHNEAKVDAYLQHDLEIEELLYQDYLKQEPSDVVKRLRALAKERANEGKTPE